MVVVVFPRHMRQHAVLFRARCLFGLELQYYCLKTLRLDHSSSNSNTFHPTVELAVILLLQIAAHAHV
eukprot:4922923-Heterocapsa_arctica.AAC.1